jgi:hypothetical protein
MRITGLGLLLITLLSACWPSSIAFLDKGSMPDEWKTFSVKTVENNSPNTPISYAAQLSEQLKDGIQNNTRLLLNPETGKGEIYIEGKITNYSIAPIAVQQGDNSAKNRLSISAQFTIFVSAPQDDKMTVSSTRFVDYASTTDLATAERTLLEDVTQQIIQDVINKLLSNW